MGKSSIIFFERKFPSANMILIKDKLPILIDTGFGSEAKDTEQSIKEVNDIGWLNIFREGVSSIQRSMESLDRLSMLRIQHAYSGHGPKMENPLVAIDAAKVRFEKWLRMPEKVSWHACKRIFSFTLIIKNGLSKGGIDNYLLKCGWFQDFARYSFQLQPEEFIQILLDEMIRSGAASWHNNHLIATTQYQAPQKKWMNKNIKPKDWKPQDFLT